MSNAVVTVINDGARNVTLHVFVTGDAGGDLIEEIIADPVDFGIQGLPSFTLDSLAYDLTGFSATLSYDYLVSDTPLWAMSQGQATQLDFKAFGGFKDRSDVLDGTGKIKLTTSGLAAGRLGSFVLCLRKV